MAFCCQVKTEISVESKHQTLQGLAFPLQRDVQQAVQLLKQKKINYIQLVRRHCQSPLCFLVQHTFFCSFLLASPMLPLNEVL